MSDSTDGANGLNLQSAVLRAAQEIELRPFLREVIQGALAVTGAANGAVILTLGEEHERGREPGEEDIIYPRLPDGTPPDRWLLPRDIRRIDSASGTTTLRIHWSKLAPSGQGVAGNPPAEVILTPLCAAGRRLGSILLIPAGSGGVFSETAFEHARRFSELLIPFLGNVLRVLDLEDTVVRDDMAECYNRRYLDEFLAQETARARRFRKPLSLIFLDMDDLKSVNSQHGHGAGSRVLQEVARRIGESTRRIDKLFRFGGDEFCLLLPETDLNGSRRVAERVRLAIASSPLLVAELPGGVSLTASLGIATFPVHSPTGEGMLAAADAAMRSIKDSGKNAVGVSAPAFPWETTSGDPDGPGNTGENER